MKKIKILLLIVFSGSLSLCSRPHQSPLPASCEQLLLVVTPSPESSHGKLIQFERSDRQQFWKPYGDSIAVVVGKRGLAWGRGLHDLDKNTFPLKQEGDGKSPAGAFTLGTAFGYLPPEEIGEMKFPYQQVKEGWECIDDVNSRYYNRLIQTKEVESRDWHSSERMYSSGIWYELGVVINHNTDPVLAGAGSCIFLHNWSDPADSTTGCTAMDQSDLKKIIHWLNEAKNPVLVQLSLDLYRRYQKSWRLP